MFAGGYQDQGWGSQQQQAAAGEVRLYVSHLVSVIPWTLVRSDSNEPCSERPWYKYKYDYINKYTYMNKYISVPRPDWLKKGTPSSRGVSWQAHRQGQEQGPLWILISNIYIYIYCYYIPASGYYCFSICSSSLPLTCSCVSILILQWLSSPHILTQHGLSHDILQCDKKETKRF